MPSSIDLHDLHKQQQDRQDVGRPSRGIIRMPLPETEAAKIESVGEPGTVSVSVRHPFVGKNSWLRCMPESGTSVVVQQLRSPTQVEIWGYLSERLDELLYKYRTDDETIFRQLQPGELEAMSAGRGYQHWSEDGDVTLLGGVVEQYLLQTELEWLSRSPTHRRQLDQQEPTLLGHEERFGLVKRPDTQKPNAVQIYMKDGDKYQYEYLRYIKDDDGKDVTMLHEGHTFDAAQQQIKNGQTNRRVRLRRTVERRTNDGTLTFDVDEDLNLVMTNSTTKKVKADFDFGLKSEVKLTSEKLDFNILKSSNQVFATSATMRSPKLRFNSPDVGFGPAPVQPAVLGSALTANVLTPMVAIVQSGLAILAADPAMSPQTKTSVQNLTSGMSGLPSAISSVLSAQVKFTS